MTLPKHCRVPPRRRKRVWHTCILEKARKGLFLYQAEKGGYAREMNLRFARAINQFYRDERGATALEYAMIASLLSVAIVSALIGLNVSISSMFDDVFTRLREAIAGAGAP